MIWMIFRYVNVPSTLLDRSGDLKTKGWGEAKLGFFLCPATSAQILIAFVSKTNPFTDTKIFNDETRDACKEFTVITNTFSESVRHSFDGAK